MPVAVFDQASFGEYVPHPGAGLSPAVQAHAMTTAAQATQSDMLHNMRGARRKRTKRTKRTGGKVKKIGGKRPKKTRRRRGGGGDGVPFNPPAAHAVAPGSHYHPHDTIASLLATGSQHAANSVGDGTMNDAPIVRGAGRR